MTAEKKLQNAILLRFATRPDMRLWRANTGHGISMDGKRHLSFGIPGQADLSGILRDGRRLEIECKSPNGQQSEEQRNFAAMIRQFNGVYILARSVEDVERGLQEAGI